MQDLWKESGRIDAAEELKSLIAPLPEGMFPIVVAGGSFNNSSHRSDVREAEKRLIDQMLDALDPTKIYFVIGHSLSGHEGYLAERNRGRFRIAAIVPNRSSRTEKKRLLAAGVLVRVSIESSGMGLYKSFSYEVFKRTDSALIAFDGNAPAQNLMQEAKNARGKCRMFVNPRSKGLRIKAKMLEGYVEPLPAPCNLITALTELTGK